MPTGHDIHAAAVTRDYISQPRISNYTLTKLKDSLISLKLNRHF